MNREWTLAGNVWRESSKGLKSGVRLTSLRARLMTLAALTLLPAFVLIAYNSWTHRAAQKTDAQQDVLRHARNVGSRFGDSISETRRLLAAISQLPAIGGNPSHPHCSQALAVIHEPLPQYLGFGVALPDGRVACHALPFDRATPPSATDRLWFKRALENRAFTIGEYQVGRITGKPSINFAHAVLNDGGEVAAVVFAALDLAWWRELATTINRPNGSALTLLDREGRILVRHPGDEQWVGRGFPGFSELRDKILSGEEGLFEQKGVDGVLRFYSLVPIPETNNELFFLAGFDRQAVFASADAEAARSLLGIVLLALVAFAGAWFGAGALVLRRVQQLIEAAECLGRGDVSVRTGLAHNRDELGELAARFDRMAEAIEARERSLESSMLALKRANRASSLLVASSQALLRVSDEPTLLADVCRLGVLEGGYSMAWIGRREHDGKTTIVAGNALPQDYRAHLNATEAVIGEAKTPSDTAIREDRPVVVRDIATDSHFTMWRERALKYGYRSACALPIRLKGEEEVWGVLAIYSGETDAFDAEELRLLTNAVEDLSFGLLTLRTRQDRAAAERASRLKSEFLASMSHELRTPLNAIIGFSEVLKDGLAGELTDEQREYATDIFQSGQHLLSLINDVLDLSKIEAGKMSLELESVHAEPLLRAALSVVKEKAASKRIALGLETAPDLAEICVDARKLKQIVYNLLSNAVKFTPDGGRVTLSARRVAREYVPGQPKPPIGTVEFLEIAVVDTGIGISAEDLSQLFQPFTQLDSSLSRRFQGTGLGLSLVKRLVELHCGTVAVQSEPGKGSKFSAWFPYRPMPVSFVQQSASARPALQPRGNRAVVVEDNDQAANLLRLYLERAGFSVVCVASAEEGREQLAEEVPDLVILDLLLPGEDGWHFLGWLKETVTYAHIPVVVVSIVADREKGVALGASHVLSKPVVKEEFQSVLAQLGFGAPKHGGAQILLIDDDSMSIELLSAVVTSVGHQPSNALGGKEGIAAALNDPPDLIVLDLLMPDLSGFEVVSALRSNSRTASVPIVIVTAKDLTKDDMRRLNGSVATIVAKSEFTPDLFITEVHRALVSSLRPAQSSH